MNSEYLKVCKRCLICKKDINSNDKRRTVTCSPGCSKVYRRVAVYLLNNKNNIYLNSENNKENRGEE